VCSGIELLINVLPDDGLMWLKHVAAILIYCNVLGWLETPFGLVIGFINTPQVVTKINSYTLLIYTLKIITRQYCSSFHVFSLTDSHTSNKAINSHFGLHIFTTREPYKSHWVTHSQFSLHYNTHKSSLLASQLSLTIFISSQADLLYSSVLLAYGWLECRCILLEN
jgi:hypothetical protein